MGTKHRTKIVAVPTTIVTVPVKGIDEETLKKMPTGWLNRRRGYKQRHYQVYLVAYKHTDGSYHPFRFKLEELQKKTNKNNIKGELTERKKGFSVVYDATLPIDSLFFVYFENKLDTKFDTEYIIDKCSKYIGKKKILDADWVISCGQDFTYEKPYGQLVLQPKLNRKYIDLRKEWADNPKITFYFSGNVKLFREVQKLLIEKYGAVGKRKYKVNEKGYHQRIGYYPYEIIEEFPTYNASHLDKPIVYDYLYISNTVEFMETKNPRIRVKNGEDRDTSLFSLYKREKGLSVKSIEQVEEFLDSYQKYIKLVLPKQVNL